MSPFMLAGFVWAMGAIMGFVFFITYSQLKIATEKWTSFMFACVFAAFSILSFIRG